MIARLAELIVDESTWLTVSLGLAMLSVIVLLSRRSLAGLAVRWRVMAAMNLFFGITIVVMASGPILAVTVKLLTGTLEGPVAFFYAIGLALVLPSSWLIHHTSVVLTSHEVSGRGILVLNAWMAATLLALGIHNLPLAAPAFFNIGYQLHTRPAMGWLIVGLAVVTQVGLFAGSLVFLASGQTFEQFTGTGGP